MIIYTLNSHSFDLLPLQVAAIRHFLSPDSICVVEGPWGRDSITSAGILRLTDEAAKLLSVDRLTVNEVIAGLLTLTRIEAIFRYVYEHHRIVHPGQPCIIMHGDLLPIKTMTVESLLDGQQWAGRIWDITMPRPTYTWIAISDFNEFPSGEVIGDKWGDYSFRAYTADRRLDGMEDCQPGFIHIDKQMFSDQPAYAPLWHERVESVGMMLANMVVPEKIECLTETVANAKRHRPRHDVTPKVPVKTKPCKCSRAAR
jgi:hypothetical protein